MINFLLGVSVSVIFVLAFAIVYLIKKPNSTEEKKTEEEKRKEKEHNDHYANMMNYSQEKAYGGGNV